MAFVVIIKNGLSKVFTGFFLPNGLLKKKTRGIFYFETVHPVPDVSEN